MVISGREREKRKEKKRRSRSRDFSTLHILAQTVLQEEISVRVYVCQIAPSGRLDTEEPIIMLLPTLTVTGEPKRKQISCPIDRKDVVNQCLEFGANQHTGGTPFEEKLQQKAQSHFLLV